MSPIQPPNFNRNVLTNYLNAIILVVTGFLITPVLTHHLGLTRYGVWVLIGGLIPYFELLELGFANSTVTYVARNLEVGGSELVNRTLNTSFFVLMVPGLLAGALAAVVAIFLPDIVHSIPPHLVGQARILLLLLAFDMVVSIPMDTFGGALIAFQRYDLLNATLITIAVLQVTGWFIVLELHGGLVALGVVTVSISLVGQAARFLLTRRLVPGLSVSLRAVDRGILRSFIRISGWFSLAEISGAVIGGVDLIIVGIVVGVRGAAIFAVGLRLGTLPGRIITPPTDVLFPYAGQLAGRGDDEGMRTISEEATRLVMAIAVPAGLAVILLAVPAVRAWVGPSFHQSAEIAAILAASIIVHALVVAPSAVVAGSGRPGAISVVTACEAVVHVVLAVVLCHLFGVIGAAEAGLICAVGVEALVLLPILCKKLGIRLPAQLLRLVRAHILPVLVVCGVGWSLARWPLGDFVKHQGRLAGMAMAATAGLFLIVLYSAILAFTGMQRSERDGMVARVRSRLRPSSS